MFTMGQAAKAAGISKTSIHRAINSGKISALRNSDGTISIDPAELFRVYPRNTTLHDTPVTLEQTVTAGVTDVTASDQATASQIAALERQLEMQAERIAELKDQRDAWQRQAEQTQRILASPQAPHRNGLWSRLLARF